MIRRPLVVFVLSLAAAACAAPAAEEQDGAGAAGSAQSAPAAGPITKDNWLRHPKIIEVRDEVRDIDNGLRLTVKDKSASELCEESGRGDLSRAKHADATGRVRKYVAGGGSDDSSVTITYYYDAKGTLRFVYDQFADVFGNASESRAYFDASGARIWTVYRQAQDHATARPKLDDAPFEVQTPEQFPIGSAAQDPGAMFDAPPSCG